MPPRKSHPRKRALRKRKQRRARPIQTQQVVKFNSIPDKPVRFIKTIYAANAVNGADDSPYVITGFTIANVPDWTNIKALYNRYKINKIHMTFRLKVLDTYDMNKLSMPTLRIRYNYDSNLASDFATVDAKLQEANNVKQCLFTPNMTEFQYTVIPFTVAPVYLSSVASGYELQKKRYIDALYDGVPHYGIMWTIDYLPEGLVVVIDVSTDFTVKYIE